MKISKSDKDIATSAFWANVNAINGYEYKDGSSVKTVNGYCFMVSENVRRILIEVIDAQYDNNLSVAGCIAMLEKIAGETVE